MRKNSLLLAAFLTVGGGSALAVPATPLGDHAKIEQLVQQLGSTNFRQREAATKDLDTLGEAALPELKKAASSKDMEIASRAKALCEKIEARTENARFIAPTYVELKLKDMPVEEAVAELSKKSGIAILIGGDKSKITDRKVTLDTGRVTFWNALAMLCDKADLVEGDNVLVPAQPVIQTQPAPQPPVQGGGPIRIQPVPANPGQPVPAQLPNAPAVQPAPLKGAPAKPVQAVPVQAAPVQAVPVQAVPVQAVPVQAQIQVMMPAQGIAQALPIRRPPIGIATPQATIILVDGKTKFPGYGESAIRVRALPQASVLNTQFPQPATDEIGLVLNLTAEPRLQLQQILGVKLEKCLDDCKQDLSMVALADMNPNGGVIQQNGQFVQQIQIQGRGGVVIGKPIGGPVMNYFGPNLFPIKLKKSEKETGVIKELSGVVSLKMRTPAENLVSTEKLLKAKGETFKGKGNVEMKINDVKKAEDGSITVEVEMTFSNEITPFFNNTPIQVPLQGIQNGGGGVGGIQIQIQPAIAPLPQKALPPNAAPGQGVAMQVIYNNTGIELEDAKGKVLPLTAMQYTKNLWQPNAQRVMGLTMTFKPADKEQGEAATLVFKGTRLATVDVPFILKDVPVK